MTATDVMAGIILGLTLLFLGILIRQKEVQTLPGHKQEDIEKCAVRRQPSPKRQEEAAAEDPPLPSSARCRRGVASNYHWQPFRQILPNFWNWVIYRAGRRLDAKIG